MTGENSPGPPLDFSGPSCLDILHVAFGLVQAGEQFGSHIGAFFGRQRQGFAEKLLRTGGHRGILAAVRQPTKPLQPSRRRTDSERLIRLLPGEPRKGGAEA